MASGNPGKRRKTEGFGEAAMIIGRQGIPLNP